jgi:hypothetical protein
MASTQEHAVEIRLRNQKEIPSTRGILTTLHLDQKERLKNALNTTLLMLALMAGSVLIPFWHFLLVPSFFALAWILGMGRYGERIRCEGGVGKCPHCGNSFKISKSSWKPKLTDTCESCFQELEITPLTPPGDWVCDPASDRP